MKKIELIDLRIRSSSNKGIFHDSREDVRNLAKVINQLIDKQNEVIDTVNELIQRYGGMKG